MFTAFKTHLINADRSEKTISGYVRDMSIFARWFLQTNSEDLTPQNLTPSDIREYRQHLQVQRRNKASTINRHLAAIRSYASWAVESGLIEVNPADASRIKGIKTEKLAPKWLDKKERFAVRREMEKRLQNAKSPKGAYAFQNIRNYAIVMLLMNTGLRIGELCDLRLVDITLTERKGSLAVLQGKGSKHREVPLNKTARGALQEWFELRKKDAVSSEHLFCSSSGKALKPRSVQFVLKDLSEKIGVSVTPHRLRHTFAKALIDQGIGIEKVASLLGHASLNTTKVYITPSLNDLENAVELLD
ncbi:MAG: tyrosine-type recombinase/integrase [Anaerolineaceae bacterium]|nr:tyrosine-type recombinase/integrase [Anaerolineaceae bacterium]